MDTNLGEIRCMGIDGEGRKEQDKGQEDRKDMLCSIILLVVSQFVCMPSGQPRAEAASKNLLISSKLGYTMVTLVILMLMTLVTIFIFQMTSLSLAVVTVSAADREVTVK